MTDNHSSGTGLRENFTRRVSPQRGSADGARIVWDSDGSTLIIGPVGEGTTTAPGSPRTTPAAQCATHRDPT